MCVRAAKGQRTRHRPPPPLQLDSSTASRARANKSMQSGVSKYGSYIVDNDCGDVGCVWGDEGKEVEDVVCGSLLEFMRVM